MTRRVVVAIFFVVAVASAPRADACTFVVTPDRCLDVREADAGEGRFTLRLWQGQRYRLAVGPRYNPDAELEFLASGDPLTITLRRR